jgi:hypothetical protein
MTLQEMIELSILDAMGLLDEEERLAFELAFRAAAPAVQAQVRREQTRLSSIDALLPRVAPPSGLRAAVVEAVRREIAAGVAAASTNPALMIAEGMIKSGRVSSLWRAGSLGLAAAALVLGITTFKLQSDYKALEIRLQNDAVLEVVSRELGPSFVRNVLFSKDTRRVILTPKTGSKGAASVWVNNEWKDGFFFCNAMPTPKDGSYKIAIIDGSDRIVRELGAFQSDGELIPVQLKGLTGIQSGRVAVGTPGADGKLDSIVAEGELGESSL